MSMSSIITDTIDCPQCGLPAHKNEYYVVGEEQVVCNWCGYNHVKTMNGTKSNKGYGSIHCVPKNENGSNQTEQIIRLNVPTDIVRRHKVIMDIQENQDIDKSSFYIWNEERGCLECLVGKMPKTLDEVYQEERNKADYYRQSKFNITSNSKERIEF